MAHAYTTKRGKNKMSKLGVRKDHQQNDERSLKSGTSLSSLLYDGPKESGFGAIGHVGNHSINGRLNDVKSRLQRAIMNKCSSPECKTAANESTLSECSACHETRYCSKECQLNHWEAHKVRCKEIRKMLKAKEAENVNRVKEALSELNIKIENTNETSSSNSENQNIILSSEDNSNKILDAISFAADDVAQANNEILSKSNETVFEKLLNDTDQELFTNNTNEID